MQPPLPQHFYFYIMAPVAFKHAFEYRVERSNESSFPKDMPPHHQPVGYHMPDDFGMHP